MGRDITNKRLASKKFSMMQQVLHVRNLHKRPPVQAKPSPLDALVERTLGFRQALQEDLEDPQAQKSNARVVWPKRSLGYQEATPILFLLDRMTEKADAILPRSNRLVEQIADVAGMQCFRRQPEWRQMTEQGALRMIKTPLAKRAAMVVLMLLLKTAFQDSTRQQQQALALRHHINAEPVCVPVDTATHQRLAFAYFRTPTPTNAILKWL